jgi:hypothetical protein
MNFAPNDCMARFMAALSLLALLANAIAELLSRFSFCSSADNDSMAFVVSLAFFSAPSFAWSGK